MSRGPSLPAVAVRKKNRATTNHLLTPCMAAQTKLPGDQETSWGRQQADRASVRKKKRGQKDSERSRGVLSPRLELGISRVSGGRINQLSHESAIRLRTLIGKSASGCLCPGCARALVVAVATGAGTDRGRRHAGRVGSTLHCACSASCAPRPRSRYAGTCLDILCGMPVVSARRARRQTGQGSAAKP